MDENKELKDSLDQLANAKFKCQEINKRLQKTNKRLKEKLDVAEVVLQAAMDTFQKLSVSEDEGVRGVAVTGASLIKGILEDVG